MLLCCFCWFLQRVPIFAYFSLVAHAKYKSNTYEACKQRHQLSWAHSHSIAAVRSLMIGCEIQNNTWTKNNLIFPLLIRHIFFSSFFFFSLAQLYQKRYKYESLYATIFMNINTSQIDNTKKAQGNYVKLFNAKWVTMKEEKKIYDTVSTLFNERASNKVAQLNKLGV